MVSLDSCSPIPENNANNLPPGVKEFDVSLDSQTATIKTDESLDYSTVLEKIKKTGKAVNSGEADGVAQTV